MGYTGSDPTIIQFAIKKSYQLLCLHGGENVNEGLVVAAVVGENVNEGLVVASVVGEKPLREATYRILAPYEGCNE